MIKARFRKPMDVDKRLIHFPEVNDIASELNDNIIYVIGDGKMGVMSFTGIILWDYRETPQEIGCFKREYQDEILDIYETYLNRLDMIDSKGTTFRRYKPRKGETNGKENFYQSE